MYGAAGKHLRKTARIKEAANADDFADQWLEGAEASRRALDEMLVSCGAAPLVKTRPLADSA